MRRRNSLMRSSRNDSAPAAWPDSGTGAPPRMLTFAIGFPFRCVRAFPRLGSTPCAKTYGTAASEATGAVLEPHETKLYPAAVPATGLVTCMVLALSLSIETFLAGIGLLGIGLLGRLLTRA